MLCEHNAFMARKRGGAGDKKPQTSKESTPNAKLKAASQSGERSAKEYQKLMRRLQEREELTPHDYDVSHSRSLTRASRDNN